MGSATEKPEATDGRRGSGYRGRFAVPEKVRKLDKLRVNKERTSQRQFHWVRPW